MAEVFTNPNAPQAVSKSGIKPFHIVAGVIVGVLLLVGGFLAYYALQPKSKPSVTVTNLATRSAAPSASPSATPSAK